MLLTGFTFCQPAITPGKNLGQLAEEMRKNGYLYSLGSDFKGYDGSISPALKDMVLKII